jgi:hypothetical protein
LKNIFHITNGDYLADQLKETSINGEIIICREALVSGPLQSDSLEDFWKIRSEFILKDYNAPIKSYYRKVVSEFEKMINLPENSEVNLWFEDDLFCQANLWFCISLLSKNKDLKIYRVFPKTSEKDHWKGFSVSTNSDLKESLRSKVVFKEKDVEIALHLWKAYQNQDKILLKQLSANESDCFYFLKEVIDVYSNKDPEVFIKNLIENGTTDFNSIFKIFQEELGIFGFGDLQVKSIFEKFSPPKQ